MSNYVRNDLHSYLRSNGVQKIYYLPMVTGESLQHGCSHNTALSDALRTRAPAASGCPGRCSLAPSFQNTYKAIIAGLLSARYGDYPSDSSFEARPPHAAARYGNGL